VFWEVSVYDNTRYQTIRNLIISILIFPASAINYLLLIVSLSLIVIRVPNRLASPATQSLKGMEILHTLAVSLFVG
jgi:hypothetical protein